MIINDDKKFGFVHIQKNAGSSITKVLSGVQGCYLIGEHHGFVNDLEDPTDYFIFTVVRNPWDRLYSWYNMMVSKGRHNDFSRYLLDNSGGIFSNFLDCTAVISESKPEKVRSRYKNPTQPYLKSISFNQLDYITGKDGKVVASFIGRFESIDEDFSKIAEKIGIPGTKLPHTNSFPHDDYRKYYTDADAEKVAKMYARDIAYFGYSF